VPIEDLNLILITVHDTEMALNLRMSGGFKVWKILCENEHGKLLTRRTGKWRIMLNWKLGRFQEPEQKYARL
jgi:hypothetical protein